MSKVDTGYCAAHGFKIPDRVMWATVVLIIRLVVISTRSDTLELEVLGWECISQGKKSYRRHPRSTRSW